MSKHLWLAIPVLVGAGLLVLVLRGCDSKPTKAERQADSVLADTTRFVEDRRVRDSVIAASIAEIRKLKQGTRLLKDSVQTLIKAVDQEQAAATTLTDVPSGISPHDSIVHLSSALASQQQVAARLRLDVVPALERIIRMDSLTIWRQDATIESQRLALVEEQRRNDVLTDALKVLRVQKKGFQVLGIQFPGWVDEALLVGGTAVVAYRVGRASS